MAETGGTTPDYSLSSSTLAAVKEAGVDPKVKKGGKFAQALGIGKGTARQALQRGKMVDKVGDSVASALEERKKEQDRKAKLAEEAGIKWDTVFEDMKGRKGWASDQLYQDFMKDEKEFRAQYIELVESGDKEGAARMLREQQRRADGLAEWKESMTSAASMAEQYDLSELLIGENNDAGFKRYMLQQLSKNGENTEMSMSTEGGGLSDDGKERMAALDEKYSDILKEDGEYKDDFRDPKEEKQFQKKKEKYEKEKAKIEGRFTEETTQGNSMMFNITGSDEFNAWFAKEYPEGVTSGDIDKMMTSAVSPVIRKEGFEKMTLTINTAATENPDTEFDFEKRHKGNTDIYAAELRKNPDAAGSILRDPWAGDNSLMTDLTNAINEEGGGFQFKVVLNNNGEEVQGIKVDEGVDADTDGDGVLSMTEMGLDDRDIETIMDELEKDPEMLAAIAGEWTALKQEKVHNEAALKGFNSRYEAIADKALGTQQIDDMLDPTNVMYDAKFAEWYKEPRGFTTYKNGVLGK